MEYIVRAYQVLDSGVLKEYAAVLIEAPSDGKACEMLEESGGLPKEVKTVVSAIKVSWRRR